MICESFSKFLAAFKNLQEMVKNCLQKPCKFFDKAFSYISLLFFHTVSQKPLSRRTFPADSGFCGRRIGGEGRGTFGLDPLPFFFGEVLTHLLCPAMTNSPAPKRPKVGPRPPPSLGSLEGPRSP